jgi:hypothetical protein
MSTRRLDPRVWREYFDHLSKHLVATRAEIGVTGLDLGAQIEAQGMSLSALSYDPYDRVLTISSEALHHRIAAPSEILIEEQQGRLCSLAIMDEQGHQQIVRLTPMLTLPPPPPR